MEITQVLLLALLGLLVGLSSAFLGIGGGVFLVPLLPSVYAFTAQQTIMLTLIIVLCVVSYNTFFFIKQRLVDWELFWWIAPSSLIGSITCVYLGRLVSDFSLRFILLIVLMLTLIQPFRWMRIQKSKSACLSFGGMIGALAATVGIGMTVLSPILYQSRWTQIQKISPTANAIMAFNAFFVVIILYLKNPHFEWRIGASVISIIIPMALLASQAGRQWNLKSNIQRGWIFNFILISLIIKVMDELNFLKFISQIPIEPL